MIPTNHPFNRLFLSLLCDLRALCGELFFSPNPLNSAYTPLTRPSPIPMEALMTFRQRVASLTFLLFVFSLSLTAAKKKPQVPAYILSAQTVCVIIDPDAGTSLSDPLGNKTVQDEVEKALMKWARFQLVQEPGRADLVIVIRKGAGKPVDRTIGNLPTNSRPGTVQQTDNSIRIGGQKGTPPGSPQQTMPQDTRAEQQTEVGTSVAQDSFVVYGPGRGDLGNSPGSQMGDRNIGWRDMGKNILKYPRHRRRGRLPQSHRRNRKTKSAKPKETVARRSFVLRASSGDFTSPSCFPL